MYITIRHNSPCVFCNISLGEKKTNTVVCGYRARENKKEIPICPACIKGMSNLLDIWTRRRAERMLAKLAKKQA